MLVDAWQIRLTGVSFCPGYPGNLLDLVERTGRGPVELEVRRDRDNADDLNAIEVLCEGRRIGWVPRNLAELIAPGLDAGVKVEASLVRVAVDLEHRDRPGADVVMGLAS